MGTTLELVYEHRRLAGKCGSGVGLSIDEIQTLTTLESLFATDSGPGQQRVDLVALLRGERLWDRAQVTALGPTGLELRATVRIERGDAIEILFEDTELSLSYRFRGVVRAAHERPDGSVDASLELVGMPLLCRRGPRSDDAIPALSRSAA